jgi:UDP-N-acetylmuramyl pentapeptide phosphotransferase/UDP-N-acetylglucosamine-1-phosphate transferase
MQPWIAAVLAFTVPLVATALGTAAVLRWLAARRILDRPNERSSHTVATPRGGGIALTAVLVASFALIEIEAGFDGWRVLLWLAGAVLLAAVSWRDDRRSLPPLARLAAQAVAVAGGLVAFGTAPLAAALGVSSWLLIPLLALAWITFINFYNFMDGIDGILGVETASIGIGLVALAVVTLGHVDGQGLAGLAVTGAALGFLVWNWHPARVFSGDVGSVPLGYLLGGLLLQAASHGHWAPALILPLYFLADAGLTLLRRLARGEKIWRPHRQHFYQRAVQGGMSHAAVASAVAGGNVLLIGLATVAALGWRWPALAAALAVVALLLAFLGTRRPRGGAP